MNVTFDANLTPTARAWAETAVEMLSYPTERLNLDVHVLAADEPPCAGHQDYMCTQETFMVGSNGNTTSATATIHIRRGVEDPTHPMNAGLPNPTSDTRQFFIESMMHELGHAVSFYWINSDGKKAQAAALFTMRGETGSGMRGGVLADWNPIDKSHEDRIQEAIAEVFKDAYLSENERVFDNRTNWAIDENSFGSLMRMLLPSVDIAGSNGSSFIRQSEQLQLTTNMDSGGRWNYPGWRTAGFVDLAGLQWSASSINEDGVLHFHNLGVPAGEFFGWVQPRTMFTGPVGFGLGPDREKVGGFVNWQSDFTPRPDWSRAFKFWQDGSKTPVEDAPYYGYSGPFATNPYDPQPITMRATWMVPDSVGNVYIGLPDEYTPVVGGYSGGGRVPVPPDLRELGYAQDWPLELRIQLQIGTTLVYYSWEDTPGWDHADAARMAGQDSYYAIDVAPGGPGVAWDLAVRRWTVWTPDLPGSDPQHQDWDIPDYPYTAPTINASTGPVGVFRYVTLRR